MRQKLKVHIWRTNSTVHMQILEQEGITKDLSEKIVCNSSICLSSCCIFLRGEDKTHDDYITNLIFNTEQQAIDYIAKVVSWLDEVFPVREPKQGDIVNVKQHKDDEWKERMYVSSFVNKNTGKTHYVCVYGGSESDFIKGECCEVLSWLCMQPISSNWNPETGIYEAEREV